MLFAVPTLPTVTKDAPWASFVASQLSLCQEVLAAGSFQHRQVKVRLNVLFT